MQGQSKLTPTSRVLCINRGQKPLTDQFDGNHITIPAGYFETEFGAALHFQRRLIVPGTRNLEVGGFVSWIGILGSVDGKIKHDDEHNCEPFSDEELLAFGERIEAIDRGDDARVKVVRTSAARAGFIGGGARKGVQVDASSQANEAAAEAAEHIFEPSEESATREALAEAQADGVTIEAPASLDGVRRRVRR
jgi:hypothetical protein